MLDTAVSPVLCSALHPGMDLARMADSPLFWPDSLPPAFNDEQFLLPVPVVAVLEVAWLSSLEHPRPSLFLLLADVANRHLVTDDIYLDVNVRNQWAYVRRQSSLAWDRIADSSSGPSGGVLPLYPELQVASPLQLAFSTYRVVHSHRPPEDASRQVRSLANKTVYGLRFIAYGLLAFAKKPTSDDRRRARRAAQRAARIEAWAAPRPAAPVEELGERPVNWKEPAVDPSSWLARNPEAAARAAARSKARALQEAVPGDGPSSPAGAEDQQGIAPEAVPPA